jgi:hypothetical protein
LDIETISEAKWRKKSIEAAGNVVVPQLAYEIFETIQAYELMNNVQNPQECDATGV